MTRYFLGIEDLSKAGRTKDAIEYRASLGYHGPGVEEDRVKLIEPEGMTWLNGEPLKIGLRNKPRDGKPVVSNRPTGDGTDSLTIESLTYDHDQSRPLAEEKIGVYYPITSDGLLEVLLHGEQRQIRVTLIAEYFESSGILNDTVAQIIQLNAPAQDQTPAVAA